MGFPPRGEGDTPPEIITGGDCPFRLTARYWARAKMGRIKRMKREQRTMTAAGLVLSLVVASLILTSPARAEIIVRLEVTADRAPIHLEPDHRSPVVETLSRGAVVKLFKNQDALTSMNYCIPSSVTIVDIDDNGFIDKLQDIDPKVLVDFTRTEHPQTIALILAKRNPVWPEAWRG